MYFNLARLGPGEHLHTLLRVEEPNGTVLYSHQSAQDYNLEAATSALVVGMMEQSFTVGTRKIRARRWNDGPSCRQNWNDQ